MKMIHGMILVKLMAMLGDMLFFTQDMQSLEVYPSTVTQRKNAATIYKLIGYKMRWYQSATLEAECVNTYTQSATIPRFCTFTTSDRSITYTTWEQYDLASNTLNNGTATTVELIEGTPVTPTRTSNNPYPDSGSTWHSIYGYNYSIDDITDDNRIYLKHNNVDQEHIIVIDNQNETWELMDNVYLTTDVGRFFEFGVDNNDNAYIELIDYWANYSISQFKIFYILSSGADGEIYANTLSKVSGSVWSRITVNDETNVSNVASFIQFTHYASTYGYDPETPDEARKNSPLYINTIDTLITLADFERAVLREDGVANVRATDLTNDPGTTVTYYLGDINQDGSIDQTDLDLLIAYVNDPANNPLTSYQLKLADVNQDGDVDINDVNCLQEYISPTMYDIGDINMDGSVTSADLEILEMYLEDSSSVELTDFQLRLADIDQDGEITEEDSVALETYLNSTQKTTSYFGAICDSTLIGETANQTMSTVETLDGFVVKLYIARTDEYESTDTEYDDLFITAIQTDLQQYKILPLTIEIDLHSITRYYWSIQGTFYTKTPLSRDELQTIIININTALKSAYSIEKINFNSVVSYKDIIETILDVDSRILTVDLDPIQYTDSEGNIVDKSEVTGKHTDTIAQIGVDEDGTLLDGYTDADRLYYNFFLENVPILPGSLMIRVNNGQYTLKDNGYGEIYNTDSILEKKGSIDYTTGEIEMTFVSPLQDDLLVDYIKNEAVLAPYRNLTTQTFYFDSTSLQDDDVISLL